MEAKQYYKTFKAKDQVNELNLKLIDLVKSFDPGSVLEFGCGTGKNLALFDKDVLKLGIDISEHNVKVALNKNKVLAFCGDEKLLDHFANVDVVFTCSVLDHIEEVEDVIEQLTRIARKAVVIAETNDRVGKYYFPHPYQFYGFKQVETYSFTGRFGATYHLYFLTK